VSAPGFARIADTRDDGRRSLLALDTRCEPLLARVTRGAGALGVSPAVACDTLILLGGVVVFRKHGRGALRNYSNADESASSGLASLILWVWIDVRPMESIIGR
jgi:hypothetical protein